MPKISARVPAFLNFLVILSVFSVSCRRPGESVKDACDASPERAPVEADGLTDVVEAPEAAAEVLDLTDTRDIVFGDVPPIPPYTENPQRKEATPEEWNDIAGFEETENILLEGKVVWGKTRTKIKTLLRLGDDKRRVLFHCQVKSGEKILKAQLKVPQENYHEWKGEINAYRIGKFLGLKLPPVVLRVFPRAGFSRLKALTEEDLELITWSGTGEAVRGSLRYWVENLNPRKLGGRVADEDYMDEIAGALHPGNRQELMKNYPIYLEMGRAFVFDYLIYNNDRARNIGTLVLPDGSEKLILFDHGLAFGVEGQSKKRSFHYFDTMQMLPADIIGKLEAMTYELLLELVGPGTEKKSNLRPKVIPQIWERRNTIIQKADELHGKWDHFAFY